MAEPKAQHWRLSQSGAYIVHDDSDPDSVGSLVSQREVFEELTSLTARVEKLERLKEGYRLNAARSVSKQKRKPGRPQSGFSEVLYVRAAEDLVKALDDLVEQEKRLHPGRSVSRADLTREILYRAVTETDSDKRCEDITVPVLHAENHRLIEEQKRWRELAVPVATLLDDGIVWYPSMETTLNEEDKHTRDLVGRFCAEFSELADKEEET